MLQFNVQDLPENRVEKVQVHPSASELDVDEEQFSDIEVSVQLNRQGERVFVSFDVAATGTFECDRTLEEYDERLESSYALTFAPPSRITADEEDEETVKPLPPEGAEIDISKEVRDTLLLSVPVRTIAPEARDAEIQTEFGASESEEEDTDDEPVDPRWQRLKELRERGELD